MKNLPELGQAIQQELQCDFKYALELYRRAIKIDSKATPEGLFYLMIWLDHEIRSDYGK